MMKANAKPRKSRAQVAQRALAMLAALQESDLSREEIIAAVVAECGEDMYGTSPEDSFDNDRQFLEALGFVVKYIRNENCYRLSREAHPLLRLSLSTAELEALQLIQQAFGNTPYAEAVNDLVERVRTYLPPTQRDYVADPLLSFVIADMDKLSLHVKTIQEIKKAVKSRRLLAFEYQSPRRSDPKSHTVRLYDSMEFRDGHVYIEGWPDGWTKSIDYRVDRIVPGSARVLPNKFPEGKLKPLMLPLRYRLSKEVANYGATRHFEGQQDEPQADGSRVVTAQIAKHDVFWASKKLLKYGENCVVLEPPELVAEMTRVVKVMAEKYGIASAT